MPAWLDLSDDEKVDFSGHTDKILQQLPLGKLPFLLTPAICCPSNFRDFLPQAPTFDIKATST